jgi:predicted nicotinamide N-methyase
MYLSDTIHYLRSEEQGRKSKERWTPNKELYFVSQIPALRKLLSTVHNPPLQVVELGAGCGIVGIGLATMLANCSVLLTDLPEVEEIITRNIKANNTQDMSSLKYRNLDWENPPDDLCSWPIELILVSDCTYNADSLPVLVSALDRLVRTSPGAIILVALKRRHDSETVFFDLMRSAGFTSEQETVEVPSQHEEVDEIEFHCYRRS